ncbi:MAG: polysaccharide deacetylase family protein [Micrococcales bacterium]|nr:polysaccharide deacetylase family protein [Micrococcales bacterium]
MSGGSAGWRLRSALGPRSRSVVRALVDLGAAWAVGSVAGTRTEDQVIAVTFDDGPDPQVTPGVLRALDRTDCRATFFVLSDRVREHPGVLRSVLAAGHEVALHGDNHERLTSLPVAEMQVRLRESRDVVQEVAGQGLRWFRPPFGAQDRAVHRTVRGLGLETVVWGPTAYDWEEGTPEEVAARGLREIAPGRVLLLHDGLSVPPGHEPPTFDRAAAHGLLLEQLRDTRFAGVSVSDLLRAGTVRRTVWYRP